MQDGNFEKTLETKNSHGGKAIRPEYYTTQLKTVVIPN